MNSKLIAILLLVFSSCTAQFETESYSSENLKVEPLSKNTYRHISYLQTQEFGKVACNGLIIIDHNEAILIDTPINDRDSKELINWVEKTLKSKVIGIVVSHFHIDCLGGLNEFHRRKIPSFASYQTIEIARKESLPIPQNGFEQSFELNVGHQKVINAYLGEGHTKDNIVSYFPNEKMLYGGCLIKANGASKGYLGDANEQEWSMTVETVKSKFNQAKIIIPGHGDPGGMELLDYTIELFKSE